jgi:hypothetical protein
MLADAAFHQIALFRALMAIDARTIKGLHVWRNANDAKVEFLVVLLNRVVQEGCPLAMVKAALDCVLRTMDVETVANVILAKKFLGAPKCVNVCLVVSRFRKALESRQRNDLLERLNQVLAEGDVRDSEEETRMLRGPRSEEDVREFLRRPG